MLRIDLTAKQVQVLNLLSKGFSNKEIGNLMEITDKAVKSHITFLNKKLKTKNRIQLAIWYLTHSASLVIEDNTCILDLDENIPFKESSIFRDTQIIVDQN